MLQQLTVSYQCLPLWAQQSIAAVRALPARALPGPSVQTLFRVSVGAGEKLPSQLILARAHIIDPHAFNKATVKRRLISTREEPQHFKQHALSLFFLFFFFSRGTLRA
jgi:hypothetical protein